MATALYKDATDKYVSHYILYGKDSDTKLYADSKCTVQVDYETAKHVAMQGALVYFEATKTYYAPSKVEVSDTEVSVTIASGSSGADTELTSAAKE